MIYLILIGLSLANTLYVRPIPQSKTLQIPKRQTGHIMLREYGPLNLNDDMVKYARQTAPYHTSAENAHNPYLWLKPEDSYKYNGYYTPNNPWQPPPTGETPPTPPDYGYFYHPQAPGYYGADHEYPPPDYSAYGFPGYGPPYGANPNPNSNNNGGQNQGGQQPNNNNNNQPPSTSNNNNAENGNSNSNEGNSNPGANPEDGAVCPPGYICVKIADIPPQGGHVLADISEPLPENIDNQGTVRRLSTPRYISIFAPKQRLLRKPQAADLQCLSAINPSHRLSLIRGFCGQPSPKALSLASDCSTVGYSSRAADLNSATLIAAEKCTKLCQTTNCKGQCNVLSTSSEQICSLLLQLHAILGN